MIHYFGTDLNSAGHFFWRLNNEEMQSIGLSFPHASGQIPLSNYKEWPFNPEEMPRAVNGAFMPNGEVRYYRENGYTICAIQGSCADKRSGSKSVFFTNEQIRFGAFALKIMSTPICKKIITKMPFQVRWGLDEQHTEQMNKLKK